MIGAILSKLAPWVRWWPLALALGAFAGGCTVTNRLWEASLPGMLDRERAASQKSCAEDKAITKGISDDLLAKNSALASRVAALKRLHAAPLGVPTPGVATGSHAAGNRAVVSGPHGSPTDAFLDLAADADRTRNALTACQDFIAATWKKHGQ